MENNFKKAAAESDTSRKIRATTDFPTPKSATDGTSEIIPAAVRIGQPQPILQLSYFVSFRITIG